MNTDTDSASEGTITVVGFGRRLVAALLDGLFILFFTLLLIIAVGIVVIFYAVLNPTGTFPLTNLLLFSGLILSVLYYVGYWATKGQTLGKSIVGIKVVGADGSPVSWRKALLRYVGYLVNIIVLSIGFVWIAFDHKRQGWHDKMAGTYVVYDEESPFEASTVSFVPSDPHRSWLWLLLWLIVAIGMPISLLSTLVVLGPVVVGVAYKILGNAE